MNKLIYTYLVSMVLLPFLLLAPTVAMSVPFATYEFDSPEQERTFHIINEELRCVVCQNQSIAESNAALAEDLRHQVYRMLKQGYSKSEITDFMVQRYGDFVLYRPPFEPRTWLLWFGPGIAFVLFLLFAVRLMKRQNERPPAEQLSNKEKARIKKLHEHSHGEQK